MADIRSDVTKAAWEMTKVAQDAAYVAIGLGVIGVQKAQVRRRDLRSQLERPLGDVLKVVEAPIADFRKVVEPSIADFRKEFGKAVKELDKSFGQFIERFDATLEPMSERLPAGAQQVVQQAKEARDQLRGYLTSLAA
ncbi:MAG: hypothetical protein ABSD78_03560 [Acidimicrobiales bacterium]|jgi:methyl-accepting chemotaxis protein